MNRFRRMVSLLLAALILFSFAPQLYTPARAEGDDTDLTIDFSYAEKYGVKEPMDALRQIAREDFTSVEQSSLDEIKKNYGQYMWKKCNSWTVNDHDDASLRQLLMSTDPEDTYITLNKDDTHGYYKSSEWETMTVTTDKVLDLNGHVFDMRYDSNRSDDDPPTQTDRQQFHNCVAIEIQKGATLTIIDSSAWRGENGGKGTGRLSFTGWMINPYEHNISYYTTRDLFFVNWGNLVIYGGEFQAGRQKAQYKSNFTWEGFKNVIGTAVDLGVSVAEYASGISVASEKYENLLSSRKNPGVDSQEEDSKDDDDHTAGTPTTLKRDGTDADPESRMDTPSGSAANSNKGRDRTVDEKKADKDSKIDEGKEGTKEGVNKANADKTGKDDKNTSLAKAEKEVVDAALNKKGITGMVDKVFALGKGIAKLVGKNKGSRVVQYIHGTVVRVNNAGTLVTYGGTFRGYGSTPHTRNAVIEVAYQPDTHKTFSDQKVDGGLAYIYDGTFEGCGGANIFNFVRMNDNVQYAKQQTVDEYGNRTDPEMVPLQLSETGGVEIIYYDNQSDAGKEGFEPIPVNTANVQVRGGVFRNYYELQNVAIRQKGDSEKFNKFPGTNGTVNLGIASYGPDLIQDGRIQIIDKYGDGALVLLDKRTEEDPEADDGLFHYRLFCGDTELRYKSYLEVMPNPAETNASRSMQLSIYSGTGTPLRELFRNEDGNIRAPLRQTENYFDYVFDGSGAENYSIMPQFHDPNRKVPDTIRFQDYTENLETTELWYYPTPRDYLGHPLKDMPYGQAWYEGLDEDMHHVRINQQTCQDTFEYEVPVSYGSGWKTYTAGTDEWNTAYKDLQNTFFCFNMHESINTPMRYFTYKVYRVDPLTRENIPESGIYGDDSPLIEVKYGASRDSLKCKLPLQDVRRQIRERQEKEGVPEEERWPGYRPGDMYRVTLTVEEYVGIDYHDASNTPFTFGDQLTPAKCESSILFRCMSTKESFVPSPDAALKEKDFTPLQWKTAPMAGQKAAIEIRNGKAGMTDFRGDNKVFDVYYQWWECDEKGNMLNLLAGTDNVFSGDTVKQRENHIWDNWNVEGDGKIYRDMPDPKALRDVPYGDNGLPRDTAEWRSYDLHMYTFESTPKMDLVRYNPNLSLQNNNVFATGTDYCYMPKELAGKYIRVKAIVQCIGWQDYFDKQQVFLSHTIKVEPAKELEGEILLNREGNACYGDELTCSFTGKIAGIPAAKRNLQWQSCPDGTSDWKDVSGATGPSFTIPTDPAGKDVKYRLRLSVDGYPDPAYSKVVKASEYMPLAAADISFPDLNIGDEDAIDLQPQVSGGSGNFIMFYESGPAWATLNGYWLMVKNPDKRGDYTAKIRVLDIGSLEEVILNVSIHVKKPRTGDLIINGLPIYNGNMMNPNVLSAQVVSGNGEIYFNRWYREDELILKGDGATYPITAADVGKRIRVEVVDLANQDAGAWENSVVILGMDPPAAPRVEAGAPSNEQNDNGYVTVLEGTYPLEISAFPSFSSIYKTIYDGDFTFIPTGVWYVRSVPTAGQSASPPYTKVEVPDHGDYIHFAPVDPVPYGTHRGMEDGEFCVKLEVVGGKLPLESVSYYDIIPVTFFTSDGAVMGEARMSYDFEAAGTDNWRECRNFELTGNFPDAWAYGGRASVSIADADGNRCWLPIIFEGCRADPVAFFSPSFTDTTFHDVDYGYAPMTYLDGPLSTAWFENKDSIERSKLSFTLGGEDADKFYLTTSLEFMPEDQMILPGTPINLFVTPKDGLPAGTYHPEVYMHNSDIPDEYWSSIHSTVTFTVKPIALEDCTITGLEDKVFTGSPIPQDLTITAPTGQLLTEGVDYELTYEDNVSVTEGAQTATCTITGLGNVEGTRTDTFKINKAEMGDLSYDVYVRADRTDEQAIDIHHLVPKEGGGLEDILAESRSVGDDPLGLMEEEGDRFDPSHGLVFFTPTGKAKPGDSAILRFHLQTKNYYTIEVFTTVHFTDKDTPALTLEDLTLPFSGAPVQASAIRGTAAFGSETVPGTWQFAEPDSPLLLNAHEAASVSVIFTPEDTDRFQVADATLMLTIEKAAVTGSPAFTEIFSAGATLADTKLTTLGGSFSVPGYVFYDLPEDTEVARDTAYDWIFIPTGGNYDTLMGTVTPWTRDPETKPHTEHTWSGWKLTLTPTEEADGEETRTCSVCGETETRSIPKLIHTHTLTAVPEVPATCTEPGTGAHYQCAECGRFFADAAGKTELEAPPSIPATGHDWGPWEITKAATETEEGSRRRVCRNDPTHVETEVIPKLGEEPLKNPFTDVKEGAFYYKPVLWAVNHTPQVTAGTSATEFSPLAPCTRAQVVTFLWRAAGKPEPSTDRNPFNDVSGTAYYYKAVLWAVEKKITAGISTTEFSPNSPCTRGQVVSFLYRFAGSPEPGSTSHSFTDLKETAYYYKPVLWAVEHKITAGTTPTTFAPGATCTRGQIVTFLYRAVSEG